VEHDFNFGGEAYIRTKECRAVRRRSIVCDGDKVRVDRQLMMRAPASKHGRGDLMFRATNQVYERSTISKSQ
jgi:hypothetical protein